jgi:hypothetical protein
MLTSTRSAFLDWRHRQPLNLIEPPWYGPVCPVVWEGRSREAPSYPDLRLQLRSCNDKHPWPEGGEPAKSQAGKLPSQLARGIDMRWITQRMRFPPLTTHEIMEGGDFIYK